MDAIVSKYKPQLAHLGAAYGVKRLEVFGSAARNDFDPATSDLDFLVECADSGYIGAFDRYVGVKEGLEQLFKRSVDLVEMRAIKNPYFYQAIEQDKVAVWGQ